MRYFFEDKSVVLNAGEMIFIPKGSSYEYKRESEEETTCTIINIDGYFGDVVPVIFSVKDFYDAEVIMHHFADFWKFGNHVQKYKCISLLYNLFSYISNLELLKYGEKKKFDILEPAVDFLKKNIYNVNLTIDELHKLCGVSNTYFRKIFISKFGTNPKNYVMEKRISHAKSIIDSGEFTTARELAESVGYKDSLYFSKVFKAHYGVSPVQMNRQGLE